MVKHRHFWENYWHLSEFSHLNQQLVVSSLVLNSWCSLFSQQSKTNPYPLWPLLTFLQALWSSSVVLQMCWSLFISRHLNVPLSVHPYCPQFPLLLSLNLTSNNFPHKCLDWYHSSWKPSLTPISQFSTFQVSFSSSADFVLLEERSYI